MAHDIFISYSTADKTTADAICHSLEAAGLRCWIAPRDAHPGHKYQGSIVRAIRDCKAMVLVFTASSNQSEHVFRELHAASEHARPIVPFRVENVSPSDDFSFYLGPLHWLDAFSAPLEGHIQRLIEVLTPMVGGRAGVSTGTDAPHPTKAPEPGRIRAREPKAEPVSPRRETGHSASGTTLNEARQPGRPARARKPIAAAWLYWSIACGLLAGSTVYAVASWPYFWLTDWFGTALPYALMFVGLAAASRLEPARPAGRLLGAAGGWLLGHFAAWLFFALVYQ